MLDPAAIVATEQKKKKTEHLCLNHLWCLPDDPALSAFSYSCQVSAENWISQRNSLFLLEAGILKCFLPLCISLRTPFHQVLGRHGGLLVSIAVFKTHNINLIEKVSWKLLMWGEPLDDLSGICCMCLSLRTSGFFCLRLSFVERCKAEFPIEWRHSLQQICILCKALSCATASCTVDECGYV